VTLDGENIFAKKDKALASFRNAKLGFIFQFHHLLPEFTALENVCIPAFIAGKKTSEAEKRAKELLSLLKLQHRIDHKPSELSGGEQQRVAVARALMNNPAIVMADEPSGNSTLTMPKICSYCSLISGTNSDRPLSSSRTTKNWLKWLTARS
jgi:lipoprotein-releasing system ATP-binding protein